MQNNVRKLSMKAVSEKPSAGPASTVSEKHPAETVSVVSDLIEGVEHADRPVGDPSIPSPRPSVASVLGSIPAIVMDTINNMRGGR